MINPVGCTSPSSLWLRAPPPGTSSRSRRCARQVADDATKADIEKTIMDTKESVQSIVNAAQTNELAVLPGMTLASTFEAKVNDCITGTSIIFDPVLSCDAVLQPCLLLCEGS